LFFPGASWAPLSLGGTARAGRGKRAAPAAGLTAGGALWARSVTALKRSIEPARVFKLRVRAQDRT
jgi:hypothetical protein